MAVFSVDSDAVSTATAQARASAERVRGEVAALLANLVNLQGSWSGSASAAFQQTVEQWKVTQRTVEDSLDSLNAALENAGRNYADTEQATMAMFA